MARSPPWTWRRPRPRSRPRNAGPSPRSASSTGPGGPTWRSRRWSMSARDDGPSLHLDDIRHGDLAALHGLQDHEAARLVVIIERHLLAVEGRELELLHGVAHRARVGAAGFLDRLGNDAKAVIGAPGLQVRGGIVLRLDLLGECLVRRRIDLVIVGPGADRALHAAGLDDLQVAAAQLHPARIGNAHAD